MGRFFVYYERSSRRDVLGIPPIGRYVQNMHIAFILGGAFTAHVRLIGNHGSFTIFVFVKECIHIRI